jgi:hypothetical protein
MPSYRHARLRRVGRQLRGGFAWWPTVEEAFANLTIERLKPLAALVSPSLPARKGDLVALLVSRMEGDGLRGLWERLGELEQAAVAEAVHAPDRRCDPDRFRAKYGRDPDWGSADRWGRRSSESLLALFIHDRVVPGDLVARLEAFVPPPARAAIDSVNDLPVAVERPIVRHNHKTGGSESSTESVPLVVGERDRAAHAELTAVLRLIDTGKVAVTDKARRPTSAAVRAVRAVLGEGDFYADGKVGAIRAFAWPMLVQAAGLAEPRGARLRLTSAGRKALKDPAGPALRLTWRRWLDTRLLDELSRIDEIKGQTGRGRRGLTAVADRRWAIAGVLAACPVGYWIEVDELFRYLRASGQDFEVTRDAWSLYICDPEYGSLGYDGSGDWEILQARYALCFLFEYAATLGLIDVAYVPPAAARADFGGLWGTDDLDFLSRYDGLSHIRLTPLGAYCLGVVDGYAPPSFEVCPVLRVLSTLEIVSAEDSLGAADRIMLDRYADRTSAGAWRLTAERLLSALEGGGSVAELLEFLAARCADPLPDPVLRLLEDIEERAGRLQDAGSARLITCDDATLATLVANHEHTRLLCLLAGQRHIVVPAASVRAFRRALRELGYPLLLDQRDAA